ncbi:MAG: hypothetical protein ACKVS8_03190 [Phycisphaerales bacterium]
MNAEDNGLGVGNLAYVPSTRVAAAKARLLAWASETDARTHTARSSAGALASKGALAALGGLVAARLLLPRGRMGRVARVAGVGTRLVSWALVARVGTWLLPLAIRVVQHRLRQRAAR